jgi:predicted nucleic acid-binding protein
MFWFPDTTVLCNFAAVDRLDLLREFLGERGRWAQSVEAEVHLAVGHLPGLSVVIADAWFPTSIPADLPGEPERVQTFRRVRLFGDPAKPREHLGESETFVLIEGREEFRGSTFLTDDHEAFRVVGRLGVAVKDTWDVLAALVAWNSISAQEAFDITVAMEAAGRELRRLPKIASEFN